MIVSNKKQFESLRGQADETGKSVIRKKGGRTYTSVRKAERKIPNPISLIAITFLLRQAG